MATAANGTSTPPPPPPAPTLAAPTPSNAPANKRKRPESRDQNGAEPLLPHGSTCAASGGEQAQRDILEILQRHDTTPSFLAYEFEDDGASAISGEPAHKKVRLQNGASKTTISAKLSNGAYSALQLLKHDAARVSKAMETSLRGKARDSEAQITGRLALDDLKQIQRAKAFEGLVTEVADKASRHEASHDRKTSLKHIQNGDVVDAEARHTGTVLTLFGNAPTPKQLFSSRQNAVADRGNNTVKSELPVEEMSLPNGLTATKLVPASAENSKKGPLFEETFAPPYNLPTLHPPKVHKRSSTRDTNIIWEFKDTVNRGSKKGGYTVQSMSIGDWLGYSGADPTTGTVSPREKRKQRDRALSGGAESTLEPPSKAILEESQAKEEEALFRRLYSSFAPVVDNAKSVVPAEVNSMIWWEKVGEQRFQDTFAIDPALLDGPVTNCGNAQTQANADHGEDFDRVVESLEYLEDDAISTQPNAIQADVGSVLLRVSELIETLASHQRIRSASLPSSTSTSRAPISPAPFLASRIGKPDEPAEDEITVHHALRRELAYLVLKLPPYAIAKLDGDQLAELGVSKLVPFEGKDVKGTMEEDQVARLAKYNAMATAAGIATLTRGTSSNGQHYSTTAQRTPAIGQAANTRYSQTPQYATSKPVAPPQYQRSTSNHSQYSTPSATAPRPTYGQSSQYTRPGASQQSYGQSNGQQQYYQQRPQPVQSAYGGYGQPYTQQTPQTQQRPVYSSSQPLAQYQQRSHAAAATNAVAYQSNAATHVQGQGLYNRTASPAPAKHVGYGQTPQQPANVQPRPAYASQSQQYGQQQQQQQQSGSGRVTPSYPSQPQTPVNGYQARPPPSTFSAVASRAASGTPQPVPAMAQEAARQVQAQVNGHG